MTNIKLEVGQVWIDSQGCTRKVLVMWGELDSHQVGYFFSATNGTSCIGSMLCRDLAEDYTLITNADGTPHTPPKKYKELTPMDAMIELVRRNGVFECQVSHGNNWIDATLTGIDLDREVVSHFFSEEGAYENCRIEVTND